MTWGCNAIYRDGAVDHLVAVDYAMQQEIYDFGYCLENPEAPEQGWCHFANWRPVPADVADVMFMGYDIPEALIHRSKNRTDQCVISGKDPATIQEKIETAIKMNPNLDTPDLIQKMEKDVGVWITYTNENDMIYDIDFPVGWSTGNTALHLAAQQKGYDEIYILGFDLSSYDDSLNNIYKGTDNYLPATSKGFNSINWLNQMKAVFQEFSDKQFYWVDCQMDDKIEFSNVRYLTKTDLCDRLHII